MGLCGWQHARESLQKAAGKTKGAAVPPFPGPAAPLLWIGAL